MSDATETRETTEEPTELGSETAKYLADLASESFKRQSELDESIWRSLPFFAATFAFVAAVIGKLSADVPEWALLFYPIAANGILVLATLSMAWALRWFWTVLRPRAYEYPAPDTQIRGYAVQLTEFYSEGQPELDELDRKVTRELRLFMADQYGTGATTNLEHNAIKLKARSKVLLFMLIGFALAFACETTIFIHDRVRAINPE